MSDTPTTAMPATSATPAQLTLGPVLFNWAAEAWRDFYFRIADEAPVDTVVVGETVCAKRAPFHAPYVPDVVARLQAAGKEVVLSTLALIMAPRELDEVRSIAAQTDLTVEANDVSATALLAGRAYDIGPYVNIYNEDALKFFARRGARRVCLPVELGRDAYRALAGVEAPTLEMPALEVLAFGRLPLAISARCYHARHHGLHKDSCQFVCEKDADGMELDTLDGEPFLVVNGLQTMAYTYQNLIAELAEIQAMGIRRFRLSPHSADMAQVAGVFRDVLDDREDVEGADARLGALIGDVPFSNGYYHGTKGVDFVTPMAE